MAVMDKQTQFKAYQQHQSQMFPGYLADALDPSDPVFFIDDLVEGLDLSSLEARYGRMGEHAYPPRLLLKLWLFGAVDGVYSGREIARRLYWDLRFRYLAGELRPDFRTVNRFRERHREDFAEVFRQTVRVARESGLGSLGRVAIDGSKLRANTSRHKAMSHRRMVEDESRLEEEIAGILKEMDACNEAEDDTHGSDDGGGGLPKELQDRKTRRDRIRAAREQLEAEKGDRLEGRHQKSFADPEANMMKTGEGALQYCYNAQVATNENGVLVAADVATAVRDFGQLVPMVESVKTNTGQKPDLVLADAGYLSEEGLKTLHQKGQACLVAVGREGRRPGKWPRGKQTQRMHRIMRLPWARSCYRYRKTQGERPFAEIKQTMGFRKFVLRGVEKITGEWNLVCAAYNLRTLYHATRP
jgi:transposase